MTSLWNRLAPGWLQRNEPAPVVVPVSLWNQYAPGWLKTDGPYGVYVQRVHAVAEFVKKFIAYNVEWLGTPIGAKFLIIKYPETIVQISRRYPDAKNIFIRFIRLLDPIAEPFALLGTCAKTFGAFSEISSKWNPIVAAYHGTSPISYVVYNEEKGNAPAIQNFRLTPFQQMASFGSAIGYWIISLSDCERFLGAAFDFDRRPVGFIADFASPVISLQTLYVEGSFLYQTVWLREYETVGLKGKMDKRPIAGSLMKVALAVVGLAIDLLKLINRRETKISPATFWLSLIPNLLVPVAYNYWPKLVVEPLNNAVSLNSPDRKKR